MRWGLIPGWWKITAKEVPSTFNARAETIAQKPCSVLSSRGDDDPSLIEPVEVGANAMG